MKTETQLQVSCENTIDDSMQSQIISMLNSFLDENADENKLNKSSSFPKQKSFDRIKVSKALSQKQESSNELYMNLLQVHEIPNQQHEQKKTNKKFDDKMVIDLEKQLLKVNTINLHVFLNFQGNFVNLLKKQQASRLCQFYLPNTSLDVVNLIYQEIKSSLPELLFDSYGNYFCKKLFFYLPPHLRIDYLYTIQSYIPQLAMNKISTSSIQGIISNLNTNQEQSIAVASVLRDLSTLCLDVFGTHLIEKMLSCFDYNNIKYINNFILENFFIFATNQNSVCLIKTLMISEYKKDNFMYLKHLIQSNAINLVQNQFATYIFPICFDNWDQCDYEEIMSAFYGQCVYLSLQKYSSNIIEICINKSEKFFMQFINEITYDNYNCIALFMNNSFGNFVIQTALVKSASCKQYCFIRNLLIVIMNMLTSVQNPKLTKKWNNIISCYSWLLTNKNNTQSNFQYQYNSYCLIAQPSF
jgi:hypothetical protein